MRLLTLTALAALALTAQPAQAKRCMKCVRLGSPVRASKLDSQWPSSKP